MCQASVVEFVEAKVQPEHVAGKTVLEVGSYDVNGSVRGYIEGLGCRSYLGVDLEIGPSVDEVCNADDLVTRYGQDAFDMVLCTEVVEHVRNWRTVLANLKAVTRPGGVLLVTTRSEGFPYHAYPTDFWRYEIEDFEAIFADFDILSLESDPGPAGVFIVARKPEAPRPAVDLESIRLYSIKTGARIHDLTTRQKMVWEVEWFIRRVAARIFPSRKRQWTYVT